MVLNQLLMHISSIDPSAYNTNLPHTDATHVQLQQILQIVFGVLGAIAVLMIVISGMRFVTSGSNPQEAAKARNTIVFAVAGLLIALTSEAIVAFVMGKV
jgi:type IV secretory pathway VirB2 component (pilin)